VATGDMDGGERERHRRKSELVRKREKEKAAKRG